MDYKYIEQLLERYWDCRTSLEEEQILRSFFSQKDVPSCLQQYRNLFLFQSKACEEHLGNEFDTRMLNLIKEPKVVKARTVKMSSRFAPFLKAAATVAVVLAIGNAAEHSMRGNCEKNMEQPAPLTGIYIKSENVSSAVSASALKTKDNSQAEIRLKTDTLLTLPIKDTRE